MPPPGRTVVHILMVEDSPDDADLMEAALQEGTLKVCITHVEDGESAVAFLHREGEFEGAPRPNLILLDLGLPRMNGHEVLAEIKEHDDLRRIPVVVLTGSDDEQDVLRAYDRHANCYVTKPKDQDEYALAVKKIEHFWLHVARGVGGPQGPSDA
ncbi:MAG: response regulator [Gemmataceae bacterium]|nr:response regulator [Gemmataceae bacterium]